MKKITQFSKDQFTRGTTELRGVLGLVNTQISLISDLSWSQEILDKLTLNPKNILLHYMTEPPKCNFIEVTTFFDGAILGIDIMKSQKVFPTLFSIERTKDGPKILNDNNGSIKVFDASSIVEITKNYLQKFPILGGEMLIEAHAETNPPISEGKAYCVLAIGKPKNPDQNYLLMEDAGSIIESKGQKIPDILESIALSILGCEQIENNQRKYFGGEQTEYQEIYLVYNFRDIPQGDLGWAQVQVLYVAPPKDILFNEIKDNNLK